MSLALLLLMAPQLPFLSPVFGDHMVLQRDKPNHLWGWTQPGAMVHVTVDGKMVMATAGTDGKWMATFQPPKVGGPYEIQIHGQEDKTLHDVLVGDVWICSGQSNMEFGISQAHDAAAEIAAAHHPQIRLFTVGRQIANDPMPAVEGTWKVCTPENVVKEGWGGFSAVGYFFGRKLNQDLGVPIGLVQSAWGGTSGEAWASAQSIAGLPEFKPVLERIDQDRKTNRGPFGTYYEEWLDRLDHYSQEATAGENPATSDADWQSVNLPGSFKEMGLPEKAVVWLRKEITLPDPLPAGHASLHLGDLIWMDKTWINGHQLGVGGWNQIRDYWLWDGSIRPGKNTIAVRVIAGDRPGAVVAKPDELFIQLGDGSKIPLAGSWKAHASIDLTQPKEQPRDWELNPTIPGTLRNGMISPLAPMALRGAIWYQGETNSWRSWQYRTVLSAVIRDWREQFGQGDFPFYISTLANYGPAQTAAGEDAWAELRDAQIWVSRHVKNSGVAVTTDVGEANDIHPKDKKTVGERLALVALAQEYHHKVEFSGPRYQSLVVKGSEVELHFSHADGLTAKGELKGFMVAGADRKWHLATARLVGETVVVSSPDVSKPVAVRYSWAQNPPAPLYNGGGLPAEPFRTDDWPAFTLDHK